MLFLNVIKYLKIYKELMHDIFVPSYEVVKAYQTIFWTVFTGIIVYYLMQWRNHAFSSKQAATNSFR